MGGGSRWRAGHTAPRASTLDCKAFVERLKGEGYHVLVASCAEAHLHALTTAPVDIPETKQLIGRCKRNACGAVHRQLPGTIWAADGGYTPIKNETHRENTYRYIAKEQEPGTFVWTHNGEEYWMT